MKAVIMAGGMGTRLASVSGGLPKPMMPILGKPVMEHIVALLRENGITDICAALRYKPEAITGYFGDGSAFGVHMEYRLEDEPLGTAGGVKNCSDFLGGGDFLVISGDAACDMELRRAIDAHRRADADVTLVLYTHPEPLSYGCVLTRPDGSVRGFIEKPAWSRVVTDLVNTGIYVVSPRALAVVPGGQPFDFAKNLFPLLMERGGRLLGVPLEGYWCDIGTPEAYYRSNLDALAGRLRLSGGPRPDVPKPDKPQRRGADVLSLPCAARASLMRALSETLMEAGADFSDGITVGHGGDKAHIFPSDSDSALLFEGPGAARYMELARRLNSRSEAPSS